MVNGEWSIVNSQLSIGNSSQREIKANDWDK